LNLKVLREDVRAILCDHDLPDFVKEQKVLALLDEHEDWLRERLEADIQQLKEIPSSCRTKYAIDVIKEILGE